ncbi:DUF362 domain-containing protein [Bacteroidota bacterium]
MKYSRKKQSGLPKISRRNFVKFSALGAASLSFAPKLLSGHETLFQNTLNSTSSSVVIIKNNDVVNSNGLVNPELTYEMLTKALLEFTGKDSISDAWKIYFTPEDIIGIKLSTLGLANIEGTDFVSHFSAVTNAIVKSLTVAGFDESNFIVWDRSDEELSSAGLKIQKEEGKLRILGHHSDRRTPSIGYTDKTFPVGDKSTHISKILHDMCTAIINVPIPKHHRNAGLTCALKSHYGSIDNAWEFHANGCTNPGIPEVNMIKPIRNKQRLIICDAMVGLMESGPRWNAEYVFPYGAIMVGTDPVAIDAVAMEIIDEQRTKADLPLLRDRVEYLKMAEDLGLGNSNLKNINVVEINLS